MHANKSLKLLKKINSVFHTLMEDPTSVSALEKELLKSYIVQFYDAVTDSEVEQLAPQKKIKITKDVKSVNQEQAAPVHPAPDASGPASSASPVSNDEKEAEVTPTISTATILSEEASVSTNKPEEAQNQSSQETDLLAPIFEEVYQSRSTSHIGERLISDMKKSMGLNDKLLFANVLFGGNQSLLLESLDELNKVSDLAEAKVYLNALAKEHDWTHKGKQSSVSKFISLVVRKFDSK